MKQGKRIDRGGIFLLGCLSLFVLGIGPGFANSPSAKLRRVLVQKEKDRIKISFIADRVLNYQVFQIPDSKPALVVDFSPAVLWGEKETLPIHEAGVQNLRVAQNSNNPDIVRAVFELEKPVGFSVKSSRNRRQLFISISPQSNFLSPSSSNSSVPENPVPSTAEKTPVVWDHVKVETKTLRPETQNLEASLIPSRKTPEGKSFLSETPGGSLTGHEPMNNIVPLYVAKASTTKKTRKKYTRYASSSEFVTINWRGANLTDVIRQLADRLGLNVIIDKAVSGTVTMDLKNVPAQQALGMIVAINGYGMRQVGNILVVAPPDVLAKVPSTYVGLGPQSNQVIPLENSKASDVKDTITKEFPGVQVDVDTRLNALLVRGSTAQIRQVMNLVSQLDQSIEAAAPQTTLFQLNYAQEKDVETQLKSLLPSNAILLADERLNALIISGSPDAVKIARSFIESVDVPSPQVMLSMEVVSVQEKASRDLGVEWDAATTTNFSETSAGERGGSIPAPGATVLAKNTIALQSLGIHAFVRDNIGIKQVLHWLVSNEKAKVLGSPRVAALNNKEATINLGQSIAIPYFDPRAGTYQVQTINVGVILKMTPSISPNGDISLHLEPTVSQVISFTQTTPPYPNIAQRTADTFVRVKNGQTIVIGGLLQDSTDEVVTKIPLLGDIPIIGELFRHRTLSRDKTDLVITVTPTLIANR